MEIKQYELVLVNLDPTIGSEMKKTRPCVVISPNEMNKYLQTIVVAPLTSSSKPYPTRIELKQTKPVDKNVTGTCAIINNTLALDINYLSDNITVRETPTSPTTITITGKIRMLGSNLIKQ